MATVSITYEDLVKSEVDLMIYMAVQDLDKGIFKSPYVALTRQRAITTSEVIRDYGIPHEKAANFAQDAFNIAVAIFDYNNLDQSNILSEEDLFSDHRKTFAFRRASVAIK